MFGVSDELIDLYERLSLNGTRLLPLELVDVGEGPLSWLCSPETSPSASHPTAARQACRPRTESGHPVAADDRSMLDFGPVCQEQRSLYIDTEVLDSVLNLGVTEQYLDRTDIACRL